MLRSKRGVMKVFEVPECRLLPRRSGGGLRNAAPGQGTCGAGGELPMEEVVAAEEEVCDPLRVEKKSSSSVLSGSMSAASSPMSVRSALGLLASSVMFGTTYRASPRGHPGAAGLATVVGPSPLQPLRRALARVHVYSRASRPLWPLEGGEAIEADRSGGRATHWHRDGSHRRHAIRNCPGS